MLRHQIGVATPLRTIQVATSKSGRDTVFPAHPQVRSQHQNQAATLLEATLCRNISFMSRPRFYPQWDFQVTTPKFQVATSLTATHVATSKMMSRPQAAPESFQLYRNLKISGCNTLKTNPGRDLKSMSRPQTVHPRSQRGFSCHDQGLLTRNLSQVATPKRMSRH